MKVEANRKEQEALHATIVLVALAIVVATIAAYFLGRWLSG